MSRCQFGWGEALPYLDIDAVVVGDAEQALRVSKYCANSLIHRIGELDARGDPIIGAGNTRNGSTVLGVEQALLKASIAT